MRVAVPVPDQPVEIRVTAIDGSPLPEPFVVLEPLWLITPEHGER